MVHTLSDMLRRFSPVQRHRAGSTSGAPSTSPARRSARMSSFWPEVRALATSGQVGATSAGGRASEPPPSAPPPLASGSSSSASFAVGFAPRDSWAASSRRLRRLRCVDVSSGSAPSDSSPSATCVSQETGGMSTSHPQQRVMDVIYGAHIIFGLVLAAARDEVSQRRVPFLARPLLGRQAGIALQLDVGACIAVLDGMPWSEEGHEECARG
jgi:hypothetical protein